MIHESDLPQAGPGKFEGGPELNKVLHSMSLDSCDDECGDVQESVWSGLLRGPLTPVPEHLWGRLGRPLTAQEHDFLASKAGAIVTEDSHGFFSVMYYDTLEELEAEWDAITTADPE